MFKRLLRGFSGEREGGETVIYAHRRFNQRRVDERRRPGLPARLQESLGVQGERDFSGYNRALSDQRGDRFREDGTPLRLRVVGGKTVHLSDGPAVRPKDAGGHDPSLGTKPDPPPPPPMSVA